MSSTINICWYVLITENLCGGNNFLIGIITIAALLISDAPQWGKFHPTCQVCVFPDSPCNGVTMYQVIIHFTAVSGEAGKSVIRGAEIKE
jgi:hypothetical protein